MENPFEIISRRLTNLELLVLELLDTVRRANEAPPEPKDKGRLMTCKEAAELAGISPGRLSRFGFNGTLPLPSQYDKHSTRIKYWEADVLALKQNVLNAGKLK